MNTALRSEELDVRLVFKLYAAVAWTAGVFLVGWGPRFFPLELLAYAQGAGLVVRIVGAVLVAAGCCAWAVTTVEDPAALKQALLWWSVGHTAVFSGLAIQMLTVMGEPEVGGGLAIGGLLTASITGWYAYITTGGVPIGQLPEHQTLFGSTPEASVGQLRSVYEERIRAAAAQEERNRLARDLHDSIKQQIFVIQTAAATAQARFEADPAGAASAVEQVRSSAREAMTEMEVMLDQLRASPLENTGLVEALGKQCEALRFRTGADVRLVVGELPPDEALPPGSHEAVFRVAQEALANIGRHARASHVTVSLDSSPLSLQLRVDDDGVGFDPNGERTGMGLGNMRARASALGGTVAVTAGPGKGTLVRVSVPRMPGDVDDVRLYRNRMLLWGAALLFWVVMSGLVLATPTPAGTLAYKVPLVIVHAWIFTRVTVSYIRVRRVHRRQAAKAGTP